MVVTYYPKQMLQKNDDVLTLTRVKDIYAVSV